VKPLYVSLKPFLDHSVQEHPIIWSKIFGNENPVEVEIGIGNGEYLARLATEHPSINYVGFEVYCERVSRSLRKLSRVTSANAKVMRVDVRPAFEYLFAPKTIQFIHCLFPAPWPKKSDIKHRLMQTDFLRLANSRLKDGGTLKIVTDFKAYAVWVTEQVPGSGFILKENNIGADHGTKFERKWQEGGQSEFYEILLHKQEHVDVPLKQGTDIQHYTIPQFNPDHFKMSDFSDGTCAVVFKDYLYDAKQERALVYVLVHDEDLVQHVRVSIVKIPKGWHVGLAQGSMQMPTPGIGQGYSVRAGCGH
jgi:tRNA (guanine-N7-)-methyltransferase